jgi:peptidoglycan/LPS O-acetylase OafA/YrhL
MSKLSFDTSLLSKYRTQLMGIAILWIILRHSDFDDTIVPFVVRLLRRSGYGGVDIFFFLSGLGIYFAYQKENVKSFFKKRFLRILPYYIPIVILFTVFFQYPNGMISFKGIFLRIFILDYWVEADSLGWYIPVALLFYVLTPVIMWVLKGNFTRNWIILLISTFAIGLLFDYLGYWYIMNTIVIRLASYILGIYIGYMIANKMRINILWIILCLIIGLITYGLQYMYGYENKTIALYFAVLPFFFLSLPLCAIFSYSFSLAKNYKFPVLYFFGTYTLCLYIFHERIKLVMQHYEMPYVVLLSFVIAVILAYLWQNLVTAILKKLGC